MSQITSASFFRAAESATHEIATIKATGDTARAVGHTTWQSTNHTTMQNFLRALERDYGSTFAEATAVTFQAEITANKPLTARMVQDVQELSHAYVLQQNTNVRALFTSGVRPEASLDRAMDEALGPGAAQLTPKARETLKAGMEAALAERYGKEELTRFSTDTFTRYVLHENALLPQAREMLTDKTALSRLPGDMTDKMSVTALLSQDVTSVAFALQKLDDIRAAFPHGPISPQKLWGGCFNEAMPPLGANFATAFQARAAKELEALAPGKGRVLGQMIFSMELPRAVELLTSPPRPLTAKDIMAPEITLVPGANAFSTGEQVLARDICRRGDKAHTMQGDMAPTPPGITVDGKRFTVGQKTDFPLADDADKLHYKQGQPSTLSRSLMKDITDLCGGPDADPRQVQTLARLSSQAPMRSLLGAGCGCFTGVFATSLNEHSPTETVLTKGENGQVTVHIHTPDDPNITGAVGQARMTYTVAPDGACALTDLLLAPPRGVIEGLGPAAQDIRQGILEARQAGVSRDDIDGNLRLALQRGAITDAELDLLRGTLMEAAGPALSEGAETLRISNRHALEENPTSLADLESVVDQRLQGHSISALEAQSLREDMERYLPAATLRHGIPDILRSGASPEAVGETLDAEVARKRITRNEAGAILTHMAEYLVAPREPDQRPSESLASLVDLIRTHTSRTVVEAAITDALEGHTLIQAEADRLRTRLDRQEGIRADRPAVNEGLRHTSWHNSTLRHPDGVCEAAVSLWLASIAHNGVATAAHLNPTDCDALQADVERGWTYALNLPQRLPEGARFGGLDQAVSLKQGHAVVTSSAELLRGMAPGSFRFIGADQGHGGNGHALGVYCEGQDMLHFFDPNSGIYTGSLHDISEQMDRNLRGWTNVSSLPGSLP